MIWDFSKQRKGEEKKLIIRIKEKSYSAEDKPWEKATEKGYYHGGWIADELLALASLFLRCRFKIGPMVRHDNKPRMYLRRYNWIDIGLIQDEKHLNELEDWFKKVENLNTEFHLKYILAVKSYHAAIQIIEEQPDIAYLNLVIAIEVLCQKTEIKMPLLKDKNSILENLLNQIPDNKLRKKILKNISAEYIRPSKSDKFIKFIMDHVEDSFYNSKVKDVHGKITQQDLSKHLKKIYDQRSRTLHDGEPFPLAIFQPPIMVEDGSTIADIPYLYEVVGEKKWRPEDYVPYPHFFEKLVRHVLINFLKKNQIKRTNDKAKKQKSNKSQKKNE